MRYQARKKASEQTVSKKSKRSRAQEEAKNLNRQNQNII